MITVLLRPEDLVGGDGVGGDSGHRVDLEGAPYRHLFRARRLKAGARLRAVDGRGRARWAEVERVERHRAVLSLSAPAPDHEPDYRLHLWVAALRAERASWLVEKATEIGVHSVRLIATERTPRRFSPASLERLRRVARAAVEQCHRSRVPEISGVDAWSAVTAALGAERSEAVDRLVLDLVAPGAESWRAGGSSGVVLIGPEGGWSRAEAQELGRLGCRSVCLGDRTLRIETAALAAAAKLLL